MDRRLWLERVERELAERGLPAGVRARLLDELRDHLDDLTEGGANVATEVEQLMGAPAELAAVAGAEHGRGGWVRRHPVLVFGLAPVPVAAACAVLYGAVLVAAGYAAGVGGLATDATARAAATALVYGVAFVPFALAALVLARLWTGARIGRGWALAALAQVALVAGAATVQLTWSDLPGQSQLALGLSVPFAAARQGVQVALPLLVGLAVVWAARRRAARPA